MAWYPPGAGYPPPPGAGDGDDLIRNLIIAMGASVVNTNNNITQLGHTIAAAQHDQAGYRHLKPKKDVTKITCDGAEELLVELVQFEVDMGELGESVSLSGYARYCARNSVSRDSLGTV